MTTLQSINATGVGLIGGGRWANVHASVLQRILPTDGTILATVISPSNGNRWQSVQNWPNWRIATSMAQVLADQSISHVIIARRARDLAATTLEVLASGKRVLVEKPFCLTLADADTLIDTASARQCAVGHVFAYAQNIIRFRAACLARGQVTGLTLLWGDPALEARYGATKSYDASLNVVQDVFPHAWSVLRPFLPARQPLHLNDAKPEFGGARVNLALQSGNIQLRLVFSRCHPERARHLTVDGADWRAQLDFSSEPGTATLDGQSVDVATGFISPLETELRAFLSDAALPETHLAATRETVALSEEALKIIRAQQADLLRQSTTNDAAFQTALREVSLGGVRGDGTAASLTDIAQWACVPLEKLHPPLDDLPSHQPQSIAKSEYKKP